MHERVAAINLGEGNANPLVLVADSKKLAFTGMYENKPGTYAIDIGDSLAPKAFPNRAQSDVAPLGQSDRLARQRRAHEHP